MSNAVGVTLLIFLLLSYLFYKIKVGNKKDNLRKEKVDIMISEIRQSKFSYIVIIRTHDKFYKAFEDDDLGKVGYHIYKRHSQFIDQYAIFIIDNLNGNFMKIEKDTDSECMIGVDDPDYGHIGYLSFDMVERID